MYNTVWVLIALIIVPQCDIISISVVFALNFYLAIIHLKSNLDYTAH